MAVWLYEYTMLPILLKRAVSVVCSSEWVRQHFLRAYRHKSVTIPPGVDTSVFTPQAGVVRSPSTILFVAASLSRACEYKGLPLLLEAVNEVHRRGIPVRLVVVGEGDMKESYQASVRSEGLASIVYFTGRLGGMELSKAYAGASLFVLPTSNDSYPTVILEAMSAGLPVISTMVGEIPTMVENGVNGFVIEPHDKDELVEKICTLLTDPAKRAEFSAAAQSKISQGFSWGQRIYSYEKIFTNILSPRRTIVHCLGYYPPHVGGMEQRVQELATLLASRGEEVVVLTSRMGTRARKEVQRGVRVFYLRTIEFAHTPVTPGIFYRLLTLPKNSILHLHVAQAFFPEMVWLAAKLRGFPYVAHIRLLLEVPSGFFGILLPIYSKIVLGPVLRGAQKIIVLTPGYKDILYKRFGIPQEKIVVIPNATTFTRVSEPRQYIHTPLRILAVGRISVQKNYPLMLKVAAQLKKEYGLNFTLTIVGTGSSQREIEREVLALDIEREVHFAGELRGEALQKIYKESDLLLHTAFVEGFGTVFVEAMSKGLPIIASDVLGIKDVVVHERNGLRAPLSADEMSRAVMRLVNDSKLYADLSANNLRDVEKYNWNAIVDQTLAVYNALTP